MSAKQKAKKERKEASRSATSPELREAMVWAREQHHNRVRKNGNANGRLSMVLPRLFLGTQAAAKDEALLKANNITHIVNIGVKCYFPSEFTYHTIRVEDSLKNKDTLLPHFPAAVAFVAAVQGGSDGGGVLVHCRAGRSRSPTVVLAYLLHLLRCTVPEALELTQLARPCAMPNPAFMGNLRAWHASLLPQSDEKAPAADPQGAGRSDGGGEGGDGSDGGARAAAATAESKLPVVSSDTADAADNDDDDDEEGH